MTGITGAAAPIEATVRDRNRVAGLLRQPRVPNAAYGLVLSKEVMAELKSMGPAAVPGLIAALESDHPGWPLWKVRAACAAVAFVLLLFFTRDPIVLSIYCWISVGLCTTSKTFLSDVNMPVVRALMGFDDIRSVGAMIGAYCRISDPVDAEDVRGFLTRLLPRLTYADRDLLTKRHRRILRQLTANSTCSSRLESNFLFAIVKALVQIGDVESLPALRRLTNTASDAYVRRIAALGIEELESGTVPGRGANP